MKNLANCSPREFLKQSVLIRHAVEKWLTVTDIANIRKRIPNVPDTATPEERKTAYSEQAKKNAVAILDAIMEDHPDETVSLLALCCFIDPNDVDKYPISEYMGAVSEMIENENVLRFFTSLLKLGRMLGLTVQV